MQNGSICRWYCPYCVWHFYRGYSGYNFLGSGVSWRKAEWQQAFPPSRENGLHGFRFQIEKSTNVTPFRFSVLEINWHAIPMSNILFPNLIRLYLEMLSVIQIPGSDFSTSRSTVSTWKPRMKPFGFFRTHQPEQILRLTNLVELRFKQLKLNLVHNIVNGNVPGYLSPPFT